MMSKFDNNQVLRDLMTDCELRHKDVVELLSSKYGSISQKAVEAWVYNARPMPGPNLELIMIKLDALTQQQPGQG